MLTIKCAACKTKIMKYKKIGKGRVLRCYRDRITRLYDAEVEEDSLCCGECGREIGEIEDDRVNMNSQAFTYSGSKISR